MRRVLAISFAILVVMLATRGVMAQDVDQSVSDRLLEILKERQIISNDEYGELKGLATEMQEERAELNTRLGDLDRSITEYLAKDGDALGSNVTYQIGNGFTFATQDGRFALTIGGMFKFDFLGVNRDRNPFGCDNDWDMDTLDRRDVSNFGLDNRFHFQGHAFDPNLTYYFEFMADDYVGLFEGWVNYNVCDWFNVKGGQQRVPTGRQALIHQSDLQFGNRAFENFDSYRTNAGYVVPPVAYNDYDYYYYYDDYGVGVTQSLGISVWNLYEDLFGVDLLGTGGMAAEYSMGIYNGNLAYDNNWVAPAFRLAFYPFGYIPYVESDWTSSGDFKLGVGANYGSDIGTPGMGAKTTFYSWDMVMTWFGAYLTGEWHLDTYASDSVSKQKQRSWFLQGGYMILPQELEVMLRYAKRGAPIAWDGIDNTEEWAGGIAYYFEGQHLKTILEFGQQKTNLDNYGSEKDPKIGFVRLTFQLEW